MVAQIFAAFGKFSQNNKGSIQNFGIIGITVGAEEIAKFIFFFCPCNYPMNKIYGSTFIWGPSAILLVVGYVVNRKTWRLMTGMCNRTQGIGRGGKRIIHFLFIFCNITMTAVIAPATWIVISFLKGDYYACATWPGPDDPTAVARFNLKPNTTIPRPCLYKQKPAAIFKELPAEIIARDLRATSHIIGWWFVAWIVLIGIFFVFVFRCMSKYSYEQSKYINKYRDAETRLFDEALDAKAEAQAKIIVDQYFSKPRSKEEWDQIAAINDKVMKSKRGKPIYSPLHKFSNKELVQMELAQDDIVTSAAQKKRPWPVLGKKKAGTKGAPASAKKVVQKSQPKPVQQSTAAIMMPMVAMAPSQKVRVVTQAQPHPSASATQTPTPAAGKPPAASEVGKDATELTKENEAAVPSVQQQSLSPESIDVQAQVSGNVPTGSRPSSQYSGIEEDPIKEANIGDRNSMIMPEVDDTEDPILEANIAEQAEEIRRSVQDLDVDEQTVEETEIGGQAPFQDNDDDSEPLL